MRKIVVDTNILLHQLNLIKSDNESQFIVPYAVLAELDKIKSGLNELAYRARDAVRVIKNKSNVIFDLMSFSSETMNNDDKIIQCAINHKAEFLTFDYLAELKAQSLGVNVVQDFSTKDVNEYTGSLEIILNDEELANHYQNQQDNKWDCLINQYIIIKNNQEQEIDCSKWTGERFIPCAKISKLHSKELGDFKPKDLYQKCALDSLLNNDVTLIRGKAGTGKSLLALSYALSQLEKGKFSKLICLVNPVPVRNAQEIGFYKGDKNEKLLQSQIGNLLSSKLGGDIAIDNLIRIGSLVLLPFVDIRGYDTGSDSIVWITEAQNLNIDLMKLGLQRIGQGSKIIIDGDNTTQVDKDDFKGSNSGMRKLSEVFRGHKLYGEVELKTIYRSEIAEIADRM